MFEKLTKKLNIFLKILHIKVFNKKNIKNTLYKVRCALIKSDVALTVIDSFLRLNKKKSLGSAINKDLTPGQTLIKIIFNELVNIMGKKNEKFNLLNKNLTIGMIIGLQGTGKTTSIAKLSYYLNKKTKKILVTSIDIYRPAAITQLEVLIKKTGAHFFPSDSFNKPINIVKLAIKYAIKNSYDLLLIDTPGTLHTDQLKIKELQKISKYINPTETLLVVDSMTGQDAINSIKKFNKYFILSGLILTKLDSDTRGGIALSIKQLTKKSIKYIGTGEKIHDLQKFYPERIAKRILGMDDILSIIEKIKIQINDKDSKKLKETIKKKENFNLNDFLIQIKQIQKIEGITSLLNHFPLNKLIKKSSLYNIDKKSLIKIEAMINSMTKKEKENPNIIKGSRKKRISLGSGITRQEINIYLKQFENIKKIMNQITKKRPNKIFQHIKNYFIK
ncbi:protein component of signal recognition particle (SRP) [Buchnera aphidicola (Cinara tujafilina)]|uniref:signal-recognition-particle GTPase n=1 Tax=Buchnera aphidicola (Cinara tujafilina) TaxID=261317 RepID=F7WZU7_9GAMM|nr:signal recognition particle receptor subunit alpha [Buchnera aphidicola]AEH39839.1 protein component of signal recognition particle (SRP) [Buchnera aphidicola (Cinara tujafilina)]